MSLTRPIVRPLVRALTRPVTDAGAGGGGSFVPDAAFFAGAPGFALDFVDADGLFQDAAASVPVAAASDPIGMASDLSGNNNHATQSAAASRPIWQGDAASFASSRFLVTPSIDLSGAQAVTVLAAVRKLNAANAIILETGINSSTVVGTLRVTSALSALSFFWRSSASLLSIASADDYPPPADAVVFAEVFASGLANLRMNLEDEGSLAGTAIPFISAEAYIGSRAGSSLFFTGLITKILLIGRALTPHERDKAEAWALGGAIGPLSLLTEEGMPIQTEENLPIVGDASA